jgi:hypothetical protein
MRLFLAIIIFINLISCNIYSFTGASIHPDAKTVSINYFNNQATIVQSLLSQTFTLALQDKFLRETSLVLEKKDADLHFEGYISDYKVMPVSIGSQDQANQNRLSISVFVRFTNTIEDSQSFEQKFTKYSDFDASQSLSSIEEQLIDEIVEELIDEIFNKAVVNW